MNEEGTFGEVFREKVPWLDESLYLVGTQVDKTIHLKLIRIIPSRLIHAAGSGNVMQDTNVHKICEFHDGEIKFNESKNVVIIGCPISDAERLCLSTMPRGYNVTKMPDILSDPFWSHIISFFHAFHIMES